jgi:nitroreductase
MNTGEQIGEMSVAEAIRRKRAVRVYRPDVVPEASIEAILNAGRRAQSSTNSQPWTFILVTDREQLRLSTAGTYAAHLANAADSPIFNRTEQLSGLAWVRCVQIIRDGARSCEGYAV